MKSTTGTPHWDTYGDNARANPAQEYRRKLITEQLRRSGPVRRLMMLMRGWATFCAICPRTSQMLNWLDLNQVRLAQIINTGTSPGTSN